MQTLELFSGTKSFSKVAKQLGHTVLTYDNDPELLPDICMSVMDIRELPMVDVLWASPPCQAFSVAAIGKNWNKNGTPKSNRAVIAQEMVLKTISLIEEFKPKYWFIENPRGMLRKMPFMDKLHRVTVSYCQYGDTRQKPTDIWTNCLEWIPKPMCKPGAKCHQSAPRGSKTGTQGLANAKDRGVIPPELFIEIFNFITPPKEN